jgi:hypothetical protein
MSKKQQNEKPMAEGNQFFKHLMNFAEFTKAVTFCILGM